MTFSALIRARLTKLGVGQRDLARAALVTDSYVSQLLSDRKAPPSPERTDIYAKMEAFLQLAPGELGRLARIERAEELERRLGRKPEPLFQQFRDLILRKCAPDERDEVRVIFDAQPFGTLERLVAQTMLDVVQGIARQELDNEDWIRLAARVGGRGREAMRVLVLEFLDTDVFHVSDESCVNFLDPLVKSWSVDLETLRLRITLEPELVTEPLRTFVFVEHREHDGSEAALLEFLQDPKLRDGATEEEVALLRRHAFGARRPSKLYYYRALQNLRDPLHFRETP
ncbi:MAG TPA: helix-turn-helix transcriptional regulator [Candidatus Polarisedimenticolia bacterium]|nr:helix-turn-helix transcriptional regulator [Candidatus Polarisedimenticolia bacterium]